MICYRLRDKENRFSLMATGKYRLIYGKGEIVTAPEETLGIFCFKTRSYAVRFRNEIMRPHLDWEIYRVEGIGRGKIPNKICAMFGCAFLNLFYKTNRTENSDRPPKGLICYKQVKVLE